MMFRFVLDAYEASLGGRCLSPGTMRTLGVIK